jgi:hypothetical protein
MVLPLTLVVVLIFFWMARSFAAKHGSSIESTRLVNHNALVVEHTGNDSRTASIAGLRSSDLEHFLSKWPSRKSLRRGLVHGAGEMDPGKGVLQEQEGIGAIESEDWLLTDTWQSAFEFPKSMGEQPMMTLPLSIQSILPKGGQAIQPTTFMRLLNF